MSNFVCLVCGKSPGVLGCKLDSGSWLCGKCQKASGGMANWFNVKKMSDVEVRNLVESSTGVKSKQTAVGFSATTSIEGYLKIDDINKKVQFPQVTIRNAFQNNKDRYFEYGDILGCEIVENDQSQTKGGLGSAVVGGALFGGAGAITGGIVGKKNTVGICNNLRVKVSVADMSNPVVYIDFVQSPVKTNSNQYLKAQESAQKVMSALQMIIRQNDAPSGNANAGTSVADEIKKFKELLDIGAITQEEFEEQKKKLLG